MFGKSPLKIGVAALFFAVASTQAEIVWSDDFGTGANVFPFRDFNGDSANDYSPGNNSGYYRVNDGRLTINDPLSAATNAGGTLSVSMNKFAPFSTAPTSGTPILNVSFDLRVDSYLSTGSNLAFRFILRANGSQLAGDQMVIAFNCGNLDDGDADLDLALSVGVQPTTSHMSATDPAARPVGFIPGVGWLPGFDFGNYNPDNAADNNTNDASYNVSFSYDSISGGVNGVVTRIASDATNGFSAPFTLQMNSGLDFSNTDSRDVFILASADALEGVAHFDNIVFEAVPEPSVASGLLLGLAALASRRRRNAA